MQLFALIFREPITHFVLAALLIFAANTWISDNRKEQITVNSQTRDYLVKLQEELELKTLSEPEIEQVVDRYIEEEMLYREAYRLGLDKNDSRMRRSLLRKIRSLYVTQIPEPTQKDLREYFDKNPDQFLQPTTYSLEQVFFQDSSTVPVDIIQKLNQGANPAKFGDTGVVHRNIIKNATSKMLAQYLGANPAKAIIEVKDHRWFGPITSRYGTHIFRISELTPAFQWEYDDVVNNLADLWRTAKLPEIMDRELKQIAQNYEVVYEYKDRK
jgi:hypothetical protein